MKLFASLLDSLVTAPARNRKIGLLKAYFSQAPDPDRGFALAALTDQVPVKIALRRVLGEIMAPRCDEVLYKLSRDYIGDTAETVALLWPEAERRDPPPRLADVVEAFQRVPRGGVGPLLADALDRMDARERWALLKLLGGAPRAGVSARLAKVALAEWSGKDVSEIEEVWHAVDPPFVSLFAWLEGRGERPDPGSRAMFRPVMLAHPIEDGDWAGLTPDAVAAEWKWDGIRVQIASSGSDVRLFSRAGDDISAAFPEVASAFFARPGVLDGELLVMRDGVVAPFNDLQQRLNRKTVTAKMLRDYPAFVRLYDILFDGDEDVRALPFDQRRQRLEAWHERYRPPGSDVSGLVAFSDFSTLSELWGGARAEAIEGLMLKRRDSAYLSGRVKGQWYKWKRAALTLDCVLMYAQRGSGKRASFYSDYTFGVWRPAASGGGQELVPVGKAYSGFTDAELKVLDAWIRAHVVERFGPVLSVAAGLVLEVAFDAIHRSPRHKSGVAMRFPRIHRIRWDKPVEEADTLEGVLKLVDAGAPPAAPDAETA